MNLGYVVRPKANQDIDEIAENLIQLTSLETGLRFLSELHETLGIVAVQPRMGWPCKLSHPQLQNARTFRVSARFENYLIFYQPSQKSIEVLRVVHGSQDLEALFRKDDSLSE